MDPDGGLRSAFVSPWLIPFCRVKLGFVRFVAFCADRIGLRLLRLFAANRPEMTNAD